jgi:hypothetical protein
VDQRRKNLLVTPRCEGVIVNMTKELCSKSINLIEVSILKGPRIKTLN